MDAAPRKVEIFAPFSAAFELTKRILFQPFDLAKWLTIGFAAFLAGLADGTRFNPGFNIPNLSGRAESQDVNLEAVRSHIDAWLVGGVIGIVVVFALAMMVLFMWLGARGRFMLLDCIVHNRGAVAEPWREYRREANSIFLWSLMVSVASLVLVGLSSLPIALPYFTRGEFGDFGVPTVIYIITMVTFFVLAGAALAVIAWFVVPVMYQQRCNAPAAFMSVVRLILGDPAPFILYVLFGIVVVIGGSMVSCLVTCVTCCMAALPYVGTVILLPLYVFYYSFLLLFLRQFGPEYDVWANVAAVEPATPPAESAPPMQAAPAEPPPAEPPRSEPPPLP